MQIRAATLLDLDRLLDIDATIESTRYLHLARSGEGAAISWQLEERPLREKRIDPNRPTDELRFSLKQVLSGVEDGIALAAEHEGDLTALAVAQIASASRTLQLLDVRIDYDFRRQGIGSAMMYQLIAMARERDLRALAAQVETNNVPVAEFLQKTGFELAGHDTHLHSNHDLVKEAVTLFWYVPLD